MLNNVFAHDDCKNVHGWNFYKNVILNMSVDD